MERNSINVIIFDDDEPSCTTHKDSRVVKGQKEAVTPKSHHIEIIQQELQYLTDKIKSLQQQSQSLAHLKSQNPSLCRFSNTSIDISGTHSSDILMAIQKKIQIIVKETRKIVDRLAQSLQRKMQAKIQKKIDEVGIDKLKDQYANEIKRIEQSYRGYMEKSQQQQRELEGTMVSRVNSIEKKLGERMKEFEVKEKEYVDWIHHLQRQLQEKQVMQQKDRKQRQLRSSQAEKRQKESKQRQLRELKDQQLRERQLQNQRDRSKSKKMIDVTHVKKQKERQYSENSSVITGQQYESISTQKMGSQTNDSKIQRRHKIFQPVGGKSNSVSPQNKVLITQSTHNYVSTSKIINPLTKTKPIQPQRQPQRRSENVPIHVEKPELVIEKMTEPLKSGKAVGDRERELSPWRAMDSIEKSQDELTKRGSNKFVKEVNEDEFYKDIPKASGGWQRFQDYKQNDESESDSEQEVIFYRNEQRRQSNRPGYNDSKWINMDKEQPIAQSKRQASVVPQKVFSPFDLN